MKAAACTLTADLCHFVSSHFSLVCLIWFSFFSVALKTPQSSSFWRPLNPIVTKIIYVLSFTRRRLATTYMVAYYAGNRYRRLFILMKKNLQVIKRKKTIRRKHVNRSQ